jgi:hypothetical protein
MGKDSSIIFFEDSYNEDIDIIQVVTPEEFIKEQMQETAESVFE